MDKFIKYMKKEKQKLTDNISKEEKYLIHKNL